VDDDACQHGHSAVAEVLLREGKANVNQGRTDGVTALMLACANKANVMLSASDGSNALDLALRFGHTPAATMLRRYMGAQPAQQAPAVSKQPERAEARAPEERDGHEKSHSCLPNGSARRRRSNLLWLQGKKLSRRQQR
jgi:hypothetical protein